MIIFYLDLRLINLQHTFQVSFPTNTYYTTVYPASKPYTRTHTCVYIWLCSALHRTELLLESSSTSSRPSIVVVHYTHDCVTSTSSSNKLENRQLV